MNGPKDRQREFTEERETKLKPRGHKNQNSNAKEPACKCENETREKQADAHESSAIAGNHAEQIQEYRNRQKDKLNRIKHPRAANEKCRTPLKPPEDKNGR